MSRKKFKMILTPRKQEILEQAIRDLAASLELTETQVQEVVGAATNAVEKRITITLTEDQTRLTSAALAVMAQQIGESSERHAFLKRIEQKLDKARIEAILADINAKS